MITLNSPIRQTGVDSDNMLRGIAGEKDMKTAEGFLKEVGISRFQAGITTISNLLKQPELTTTDKTLLQNLAQATNSGKVAIVKGEGDTGMVVLFRKGSEFKTGEYSGSLFLPGSGGKLSLDTTAKKIQEEFEEKKAPMQENTTRPSTTKEKVESKQAPTKQVSSKQVSTKQVESKPMDSKGVKTESTTPTSSKPGTGGVKQYTIAKSLPLPINGEKVHLINEKMLGRELDGRLGEFQFTNKCCSKPGSLKVGEKSIEGTFYLLESAGKLKNGGIRQEKFFVSKEFLEKPGVKESAKQQQGHVFHLKITEQEKSRMQEAFAEVSSKTFSQITQKQKEDKQTLVNETKTSQQNTSLFVRSQKLNSLQQQRLNAINEKMKVVNFTLANSDKSGPAQHRNFANILKELTKSDIEIWSLNSLPFIQNMGQTLVKSIDSDKFCVLVECFSKVSREAATKLGSDLGKVIADANDRKDGETLNQLTGHLIAFSKTEAAKTFNGELILSTAAVNLTGENREKLDQAIKSLKTPSSGNSGDVNN